MRTINKRRTTSIILTLILVGIFLSSCSFSSSEKSIYNTFNEIDALIDLQEFSSAKKLLKKTAKKITNPAESLGIIKRFYVLQEDDFAKNFIKEELEDFPDNLELLALYADILIGEKKYNQALPYAQKLENTKYGSIYSELRFITDNLEVAEYNENRKEDEKEIYLDFYSTYYAQAYADIYNSTGNEDYLKNVALVYALQGDLQSAFNYHPKSLSAYDDSYFWALLSYDSCNFEQTIFDLQKNSLTQAEIELLADAYVQCDDIENAYKLWDHSKFAFQTQSSLSYHNAALYNYSLGEQKVANEIILNMVNLFPHYADGLSLFCKLAKLQANPHIDDSPFSRQLEEKGLYSLEMAKAQEIQELDIHQATSLLNQAVPEIAKQDETELSKVLIEIVKNNWEISENTPTAKQKIADVWLLLEKTKKEGYAYNPLIIQFATWFFLTQEMYDEADALFTSHCTTHYADYFIDKTEYLKTPIPYMQDWEYEAGAYLAIIQERYIDAVDWLQAFMPNNTINATTRYEAVLNLAQLHDVLGSRNTAIDLYKQILEYETDKKNRSEVYYRAAIILYEMGETKKAAFSLEESLRENPAHTGSQVFLNQLYQE